MDIVSVPSMMILLGNDDGCLLLLLFSASSSFAGRPPSSEVTSCTGTGLVGPIVEDTLAVEALSRCLKFGQFLTVALVCQLLICIPTFEF